ncbi:MAG: FAD-dependent oxidoreductase, partial [Gammaproteobacteria bacterium]
MQHVIVGAGPAGVIAAETLRKVDPDSAILLVGDELEPPYSRMALPYYLSNRIDEAGTYLRKSKQHYRDRRIDLIR